MTAAPEEKWIFFGCSNLNGRYPHKNEMKCRVSVKFQHGNSDMSFEAKYRLENRGDDSK